MAELGLDASQETRITVMQLKIERLEEKQDELRERLKVVEKWVIGAAAVLAAGTTVIGFATNISKHICDEEDIFYGCFCCLSISNASAGAAKYPAPIKASAIDPNRPIAATTFSLARTLPVSSFCFSINDSTFVLSTAICASYFKSFKVLSLTDML